MEKGGREVKGEEIERRSLDLRGRRSQRQRMRLLLWSRPQNYRVPEIGRNTSEGWYFKDLFVDDL